MPDAVQSLDAIRSVDSAGQLDDVLALPEHLSDALWRVSSAGLEPRDARDGLLICGMGGSAIGGDLAAAALGDRVSRPLATVRSYATPPWASDATVALCSSYSGNTEETLGCYSAAKALGAERIVATTGGALAEAARSDGAPVIGLPSGLQPRAAVGYMFAVSAEVAALAGVAPRIDAEIEAAAGRLTDVRDGLAERAAELAERIGDSIPVIYGNDLTVAIAYRWKCQINENAKTPAFCHEIPEMDHNEIVGWDASGAHAGRFSAIFLQDRDQHPRVQRRYELTAELVGAASAEVISLETEGETRTERMLSSVMLGDLLSLHLAARRGIDPSPVDVIERLKDDLGRP